MADINPWSSQIPSQSETHQKKSMLPKLTIVARIVTLISLVVCLALMKFNQPTVEGYEINGYNLVRSYKYMLCAAIVGLVYMALQTPFAAYYAIKGKRLVNHYSFLQFEFYGDKIILCIFASAVGAAVGATIDLTHNVDYGDWQSKYDQLYTMGYLSAGFLFIGFLSSVVSSVVSSFAVSVRE